MATIPYTIDPIKRTVTWANMSPGDVGQSYEMHNSDATVHVLGTFTGGTAVTIQGSNDTRAQFGDPAYASAAWATSKDNTGAGVVIGNSTDIAVLAPATSFIRPSSNGGSGITTVILRKGK